MNNDDVNVNYIRTTLIMITVIMVRLMVTITRRMAMIRKIICKTITTKTKLSSGWR